MPTATRAARQSKQAAQELAAVTAVLDLHFRAPGFRATVKADEIVDKDQIPAEGLAQIDVKKNLIDRKALKGILDTRRDFKRWFENRTIDCGMLRSGMRLAPLTLVGELVEGLDAFIPEDSARVEALISRMAELKTQAKKVLGPQYHEGDYATDAEVRAAFGISYKFLSFNVPAALEEHNEEVYRREMARVEAECVKAGDEIRQALRESFAGLVEHMADRLETNADTKKPRVFRDTLVTQMQDFLSTFAARNLTGDAQLATLAEQAQKLLKGVDPEKLRKQETTRERVQEGMAEIRKFMDEQGMVTRTRDIGAEEV